jgi:hypothetical protein
MNEQNLLGDWFVSQLFDPQTGEYRGPMPEVTIKGSGAAPQFGATLRLPLNVGSVGLEGQYQKLPEERPAWGVMLNYRRPF